MFDLIDETNKCFDNLKSICNQMNAPFNVERKITQVGDFYKKSWTELEKCSFRNTKFQLENCLCYARVNEQNNCDKVGAFLQIAAMIASLNANMEVLKKSLTQSIVH